MKNWTTVVLIGMAVAFGGCAPSSSPKTNVGVSTAQPATAGSESSEASKASPRPDSAKTNEASGFLTGETFFNPEYGWVVLDDKTVLGTEDSGKSWVKLYESPTYIMNLQLASKRTGWALEERRLVATDDGGRSWQVISSDGPLLDRMRLVNGKPNWASGSGMLYTSVDGGNSWVTVATPCAEAFVSAFSFITGQEGWVICSGAIKGIGWMDKQLYKTVDAGLHWAFVAEGGYDVRESAGLPGGYVGDLFFLDEAHGWYSQVRDGGLYTTSDGGRSWQQIPGLGFRGVIEIHFVSREFGSVLSMDAGPFRLITTSDGGATWVQRYPVTGVH